MKAFDPDSATYHPKPKEYSIEQSNLLTRQDVKINLARSPFFLLGAGFGVSQMRVDLQENRTPIKSMKKM